jgi:hypothetical protein
MEIIITEEQYVKLIEDVQLDSFQDVNIPKNSVTYSFKEMTPWRKDNTKPWFIYFNKGKKIDGEFETGYGDQLVFINVNGQTYITNSSDFRFYNGTGSVKLDDFKSNNPEVVNILFPKDKITSNQVREALASAFPNNWVSETGDFTAGLRGIYTIGEKLGTNESWSVMNYFDTKREIKEMINQSYSKSKSNLNITDWLINEFRNNESFVKTLVDEQWESIESGLETEKLAKEIIGANNAKFYPPGSVMDRVEGVDMTYKGKNYQIKPLISYDEKTNTVKTYGMRDYTDKKLVHSILFVRENELLEFENKNYTSNRSSATFNSKPEIIKVKLR